MVSDGSLPCSQEHTTGPYPAVHNFVPYFPKIHSNMIIQSAPVSYVSLRVSDPIPKLETTTCRLSATACSIYSKKYMTVFNFKSWLQKFHSSKWHINTMCLQLSSLL